MDLGTLGVWIIEHGGTDKMDLGTLGVLRLGVKCILNIGCTDKMYLRTLRGFWNIGVQIKCILEHWGTDKMDLGTLGVQIKWILEHWGYR